ncbi:MAG: nicotinate-nucleotide diphosphorylase (carboxylating) [Cellvibrionales bacterium]|nr:nicotinate-nucleotide diphosphorylase (carboxylating) [Cellvibrionales bacterium]
MLDKKRLSDDIRHSVKTALLEDLGTGDITAQLVGEHERYQATVITREPAVIAGIEWVNETFRQLDPELAIHWLVNDGDSVTANQTLFTAEGSARQLLTGERTALNFLQLLSGTATLCKQYAELVKHSGVKLLDTRKTIPGLRTAQKYAVSCGGCYNHRAGLYDAFLIKENHITACGSISKAIGQARNNHPELPVEIEVESLDELSLALEHKADIVMLDNFSIADLCLAVKKNNGRAKLEASGNVSVENLASLAETGVDYISIGALTKHVRAIDLSMRFK